MSTLPPKADIPSCPSDVRYVPIADIRTNLVCQLFDHLVGAGEQRGRDRESKCLGGIEVDHHL
jgi:hypothetical protein